MSNLLRHSHLRETLHNSQYFWQINEALRPLDIDMIPEGKHRKSLGTWPFPYHPCMARMAYLLTTCGWFVVNEQVNISSLMLTFHSAGPFWRVCFDPGPRSYQSCVGPMIETNQQELPAGAKHTSFPMFSTSCRVFVAAKKEERLDGKDVVSYGMRLFWLETVLLLEKDHIPPCS